ncbi:MAG: polysaccharide biosynthesis tyrosine autokinase, partial [Gammaproteobacteria bacterium]|nr:polysaccharide biosynthesis tyrosine autokinase [Gammaproteobacteria bacterium]
VKDNDKVSVKVIEAATVPKAPFKPNRKRIIIISFLLGLIGSILLSLLREYSDKTFKTGEDVIEKTKLPLLGVLPILNKKDLVDSTPERVIVQKPRSSIAEAVNNIRTNIIFGNNDEEPPQVILVTSAVASEGKTTVSANMGITLARLGPTLVIEADTRRPRMRGFMNKTQKGGVFEYVAGKASLKDSVVQDHEVKNLYTLPVKMKPAKPIEFLSSRRFKEAIAVLRKKFKFIVIDTPPILPVSDAIVLAPVVDGAILVIGAESTKHAMAKDAISRLEQVNAPLLGAVLSRANPKTFGSYGSSYYYGYGYGYSAY